jgi:hypothetical protein
MSAKNIVVVYTYSFWKSSLRWKVVHGLNTTDFVVNIKNKEGDTVFTSTKTLK